MQDGLYFMRSKIGNQCSALRNSLACSCREDLKINLADTGSLINPDKAQTLWCTLDNRAAGKPIPAVTFHGAVVERTSHLRCLAIHFDRMPTYRMPTYRKHVETKALKCKKCLSVLQGANNATSSYCIKVWC